MKYNAIKALVLTHETGSISSAARRMRKPRTMVSNWIQGLEDDWGICLFDRQGYKPELTKEGQSLLAVCRSLLADKEMMELKLASIMQAEEQRLSIGTVHGLDSGFLLDLVEGFDQKYPSLNITIINGFDDEISSKLYSGEVDLIYALLRNPDPSIFNCHQTGFCDFVAVCHPQHPLAKYESLEYTDLSSHRQIWPLRHDSHSLNQYRFSNIFWQVPDYRTSINLVRRQLGWTFCPKNLVMDQIRNQELVILNHPQAVFQVPIGLAWRADRHPGPVMEYIIDRVIHNKGDEAS
ncbi:LysR family transcriptional regulator [Endozoicomonas atrinae]|uniref:LysR family transcriptional regulator n=1 Tax=Endozoicomonas atrinae TaxID=1333660 RepID=UPI0009F18F83|nr:LysR family transcriptional regulator [Endozoicomonas atrinae]